eukprot:TRINITY_DN7485_c0_g1_i3.p1 TRINITY_DN7485_c0_g1~~TRINITY_DN7485_c0_g1_i3.p1  ORF type:complete len:450 (-),score=63.30 TRINITY_DN7485_c0_g1_i3:32-1381(-)
MMICMSSSSNCSILMRTSNLASLSTFSLACPRGGERFTFLRIERRTKYANGKMSKKEIGNLWTFEFNAQLFIWYIKQKMDKDFDTIEEVMALFPISEQQKIKTTLSGPRIATKATSIPQMPADLVTLVEKRKENIASIPVRRRAVVEEHVVEDHSDAEKSTETFTSFTGTKHIFFRANSHQLSEYVKEILSETESNGFNMIVIDPPRGLNTASWDTPQNAQLWSATILPNLLNNLGESVPIRSGYSILYFGNLDSEYFMHAYNTFVEAKSKVTTLIWTKSNVKSPGKEIVENTEAILLALDCEKGEIQNSKYPFNSRCFSIRPPQLKATTVVNGEKIVVNTSQKPTGLWTHLFTSLLPPRIAGLPIPLVLDLTSGTGSLAHACVQRGLHSASFELDETQHLFATSNIKKFLSESSRSGPQPFSFDAEEEPEEENLDAVSEDADYSDPHE